MLGLFLFLGIHLLQVFNLLKMYFFSLFFKHIVISNIIQLIRLQGL